MQVTRKYTIYAALPVLVFVLGLIAYQEAVEKLLGNNPHPELIYGIFCFLGFGVLMIFGIMYRYASEQKRLSIFLAEKSAVRAGSGSDRLKNAAKIAGGRDAPIYPIFSLLSMASRRMTIQEGRGAVERELEVYTKRITAWVSLPQFLSGLLIGMGLVGTFIGLLSALDEIATALGSLVAQTAAASENGGAAVFQAMILRLQKPMQSMGIAFSASLFGLIGSIILGFMMVATKRCAQEIVAHLRVETYKAVGESFGWAESGSEFLPTDASSEDGAAPPPAAAPLDPRLMEVLERFSLQVEQSSATTGSFAGNVSVATKSLETAISDLADYVKQLRDAQIESERNRLIQRELALLDLSGRLDTLVSSKNTNNTMTQ